MRRFLALTSLLITLAMLSMLVVYFNSATSDMGDGLVNYLEEYVQPVDGIWCWRNICPNQTPFDRAKLQVKASGEKILQDREAIIWIEIEPETYLYFDSSDGNPTSAISQISIEIRPQSITLGDAIRLFGAPMLIRRTAENKAVWHRDVCFKGGLCAYFEGTKSEISPYFSLNGLSFQESDHKKFSREDVYHIWNGFVSLPFSYP